MTGVPTMYHGIRFRSRVEARWAVMFDHLDWRWEYEPIDLAGYIPDFVLDLHEPVLVEIKHETRLLPLWQHTTKIDRSGWRHEAIVLGATPLLAEIDDMPVGGILREQQAGVDPDDQDDLGFWDRFCWFTCRLCEQPSILHESCSWRCRICGGYDGDHHIAPADLTMLREGWAHASNVTAWRAA